MWTDDELTAYLLSLEEGDKSSFRFMVQVVREPWQGTGYTLNGRALTYSQANQVNAWVDEETARIEAREAK
jgi:hypothetical protein